MHLTAFTANIISSDLSKQNEAPEIQHLSVQDINADICRISTGQQNIK